MRKGIIGTQTLLPTLHHSELFTCQRSCHVEYMRTWGQHKAPVSCQEKHCLVKCCQVRFTRPAWSATYSNGNLTPDVVTPLLVDPGFVALSLRGCVMIIKKIVVAVITRLRNVIVLFQTNTCFDIIITRPRNNDQLHGHVRWHCSVTIPNGRAQSVPLLETCLW